MNPTNSKRLDRASLDKAFEVVDSLPSKRWMIVTTAMEKAKQSIQKEENIFAAMGLGNLKPDPNCFTLYAPLVFFDKETNEIYRVW